MSYTTNPKLPRLRRQAAQRVLQDGWSTRQTARYYGYNQSTIVRWVAKARGSNRLIIPTESARPHHHAHELAPELVHAIVAYRLRYRRCAEVLHYLLVRDGYTVSLSSVKRTLKRRGLTRYSRWKKWHQYPERPPVVAPGALVEIDTIHDGPSNDRLYVYSLLDVYSRWAHAAVVEAINAPQSWRFLVRAQHEAPFGFQTIQSDHGPEFSRWFSKQLASQHLAHRHSRIRTPNDNAHLERWNRTVQEECLSRVSRNMTTYRRALTEYLHYYNTERPHLGLNMRSPLDVMRSY